MTGTLCQSAVLGRIIAPWMAMIAALFCIMVKTILAMVEKVGNDAHEPDFRFRKVGWPEFLRLIWPCLSRPASLARLAGSGAHQGHGLLEESEGNQKRKPERQTRKANG